MPRSWQYALVFTVLAGHPAPADVDDEWRFHYTQAQQAIANRDYAKAESFCIRAMREAELFGKDDVRVASTSDALGVALRHEKKLVDAEDAIRRAVDIYSFNPGEGSIEFAQAQFDLAGVLIDEGKYQPALQSVTLLLPIFDRNLEPSDNKLAAALCMQGDAYRLLKKYANAEAPLRRCAEIQTNSGDGDSPEFAEAANSLALVLERLGKNAEADRYFTSAEKSLEKSLGLLSPELADTLEAHAALLHQLGRDAEAKPKERMATVIRSHSSKR